MLSLTRKADYALVAMTYLAFRQVREQGSLSARRIAEQLNLPASLLTKTLKELAQEGLVEATRGAQGGYILARPADEISVYDVIQVMEGPMRLSACCDLDGDPARMPADWADANAAAGEPHHDVEANGCRLMGACPISQPVRRLHEKLRGFLEGVTLADLADSQVDVPLSFVTVEA